MYLSPQYKFCVKSTVSLDMGSAIPVFCKARTLPSPYRTLIRSELDRPEKAGIISKAFISKWACSCVNVLKDKDTVRICGDYLSTIDKHVNCAHYPMPSILYK